MNNSSHPFSHCSRPPAKQINLSSSLDVVECCWAANMKIYSFFYVNRNISNRQHTEMRFFFVSLSLQLENLRLMPRFLAEKLVQRQQFHDWAWAYNSGEHWNVTASRKICIQWITSWVMRGVICQLNSFFLPRRAAVWRFFSAKKWNKRNRRWW